MTRPRSKQQKKPPTEPTGRQYFAENVMPEVPPRMILLVAAETAAAMLRERILFPDGGLFGGRFLPRGQFTFEELRTLETIDGFGRSMRADTPAIAAAECDDAA